MGFTVATERKQSLDLIGGSKDVSVDVRAYDYLLLNTITSASPVGTFHHLRVSVYLFLMFLSYSVSSSTTPSNLQISSSSLATAFQSLNSLVALALVFRDP